MSKGRDEDSPDEGEAKKREAATGSTGSATEAERQMTGGPEVRADRVVFRLEDHGYTSVRLQQELQRPRSGPPFARRRRRRLGARVPPRPGRPDGVPLRGRRRLASATRTTRCARPGRSATSPCRVPRLPPPGVARGARSRARRARSRDGARLWSPPDTDPRRPLPLLVAHDGTEYERLPADAADRPRDRDGRHPALPRRAARPRRPRRDYSASARYARALAAPCPSSRPATAHAGIGASLGALALLHTRWLHPGAFGALMLQSGSFFRQRWDRQESGFPRFRRISRFVGTGAATPARPRRRSRSR